MKNFPTRVSWKNSDKLKEQKTESFQRPNLNIESLGTLELDYFSERKGFICFLLFLVR